MNTNSKHQYIHLNEQKQTNKKKTTYWGHALCTLLLIMRKYNYKVIFWNDNNDIKKQCVLRRVFLIRR